MGFFLLLSVIDDILKNVGNQTVDVAIDFHSMAKKILWKSMAAVNCLVTNII